MNRTGSWRSFLVCVLSGIAVASCGGGGGGGGSSTPPSISQLDFSPAAVPVSAGGTATVTGSIQFTDSGGDLSTLNLQVLDSTGRQVDSISEPLSGAAGGLSGTISGVFQVSTSTVGVYTFNVWVVDSGGARSNTLTSTFQVVPVASQAVVVAPTGTAPASLTAANGQLYWSETGDTALKTVSASGGVPTPLAYKLHNPAAVAFSGTDVIWVDDSGPSQGLWDPSKVGRALKRTSASGSTTVLDTSPACDANVATDVVVDGNVAYWETCTTGPSDYAIRASLLTTGGMLLNIFATSSPISALSGSPGQLVWMTGGFGSTSILYLYSTSSKTTTTLSAVPWMDNVFATDASNVYYATVNNPPFRLSGTLDVCTLWAQPLAGGVPTMLSSSVQRPLSIVASAGQVVWVDAVGVNSIPSSGGAVVPLATVTNTPVGVLVSGTDVFWTEATSPTHGQTGAVRHVPLAGGSVTVDYQGGDAPGRLALDASLRVNWTEGGPVGLTEGFGRIARLGNNNAIETVVSGIASDSPPIVIAGTGLYVADLWRIKRLATSGGMPETLVADDAAVTALTTDGSSVYWTSGTVASVRQASFTGGPTTVLVRMSSAEVGTAIRVSSSGRVAWTTGSGIETTSTGVPNSTPLELWSPGALVSDLAADGTNAYFSVPSTNNILSVALTGGSTQTLATAASAAAGPLLRLALDGTTLYWIDNAKIAKVPAAGGATPLQVIDFDTAGIDATSTIAVDANSVYWTEPQSKQIRSSPK